MSTVSIPARLIPWTKKISCTRWSHCSPHWWKFQYEGEWPLVSSCKPFLARNHHTKTWQARTFHPQMKHQGPTNWWHMDLSGFRHQLVPNTDHRCLWIDSSFIDAFGRNMAPLQRPKARWLHNKDPRLVQNFVRVYKGLVSKQKLLQWAQSLESKVTYPMSSALSRDYEELDKLHTEAVKVAEKKCRSSKWDRGFFPRNWTRLSLHLSMVPYSPQSIWPQS